MKGLLSAVTVAASGLAWAVVSPPSRFIAEPATSLHWRTYLAGDEGIQWSWPEGAVSAKLTVFGKGGSVDYIVEKPTSVWVPTLPAAAADEDVLDLTLVFYPEAEAGGEVLSDETLTATGIGLVRGINGTALDLRTVPERSKKWSKVRDASAVLPIPEGTTGLALDGETIPLSGVPGWSFWNVGEGPSFVWTLTTEDGSSETTLFTVGGLLFLVK